MTTTTLNGSSTSGSASNSENWDEDFGGDLRITDEISKVHEKLTGHLALVRKFHRQTDDLDRLISSIHDISAEQLLSRDVVAQGLDLIALANEDHDLCRVFNTPVGRLYKQRVTGGFPTLKFLVRQTQGDKENMYKDHMEALNNSTISVDIETLPSLCEYTEKVLRNMKAWREGESESTESEKAESQKAESGADTNTVMSREEGNGDGDVSSSSAWSDV